MSLIPIYDATVPISCTARAGEIPERIEVIERMHANLGRVERTTHGLLLHFPDRPDTEADVHRFMVDEKRCCQFWGFAAETKGDELILRWDGPPAVNDVFDQLFAYFVGDEPITTITGLL